MSRPTFRPAIWLLAALTVLATLVGCSHSPSAPDASPSPSASAPAPTPSPSPSPSPSVSASPSTSALPPPSGPDDSALRRLTKIASIRGNISPKSVVSSQHGLFFAQNMMYRHTVTVYNRDHQLVKTIPDSVNLAEFGYPQYQGTFRGSPVEAAFTHDGRYVYVSNYTMYGKGFNHPGRDACNSTDGIDPSFVYRIDARTLEIDQVIEVGATPKYLAVTPDDRTLLVANWCSFTLSFVDTATGKQVATVKLARHPRGIAINKAGTIAYVANEDASKIAIVDLRTRAVKWMSVGAGPRHIVLDPRDGRYMYVTLTKADDILKVDTRTGRVVARTVTGKAPRSMDIADDGKSLYVVNYDSDTVSKVRTSDMKVLQTLPTNHHPIGITFDAATRQVWVACYTGSILVYQDS